MNIILHVRPTCTVDIRRSSKPNSRLHLLRIRDDDALFEVMVSPEVLDRIHSAIESYTNSPASKTTEQVAE